MAIGLARSGGAPGPVVAAIGDSTFLHSGLPALADAVYNGTHAHRPHPRQRHHGDDRWSGPPRDRNDHPGRRGARVDLPALCRSLGVPSSSASSTRTTWPQPSSPSSRRSSSRASRSSSPIGRAWRRRSRCATTRHRGRRALHRLPELHEPRMPVDHVDRAWHEGRRKVADRPGDVHRLHRVRADVPDRGHGSVAGLDAGGEDAGVGQRAPGRRGRAGRGAGQRHRGRRGALRRVRRQAERGARHVAAGWRRVLPSPFRRSTCTPR